MFGYSWSWRMYDVKVEGMIKMTLSDEVQMFSKTKKKRKETLCFLKISH